LVFYGGVAQIGASRGFGAAGALSAMIVKGF
jgi:hypothetical protein